MNSVIDNLKAAAALLGGLLGWFLGGFDSLFYALAAFVVLDYITGILNAIHQKKISSEIGFKGICKKVLMFMLVSMGNVVDRYVLGSGSTLRTMLLMFYLSNEGISILENARMLGLPIPKKLKDAIQQLNDSNDGKNG